MLIINPPIVKPGECPAGIAQLSGALKSYAIPHTILDANLEGIHYLMESITEAGDTWTKRSIRNLPDNRTAIRAPATYANHDRYTQVVSEMNRLVHKAGLAAGARISLVDYHDDRLLPVRSGDLIRAAEQYEANPFYPYFSQRLRGILESTAPTIIGFSLNYLSQALCAFAMIGFCRHIDPGATIVLGGGLVTSWMSNPTWKTPFAGLVDELIAGPGEEWLVTRLKKGARAGSGILAPAYDRFPVDRYFSPGFIAPYSASRGCYWRRCTFCPEKAEKNAYIQRSDEQVLHDLEKIKADHNPTLIHFCDNAMSPRLLATLAGVENAAPWYGFTRIQERFLEPDFCRALRQSGCVMLKLGIESGDQQVLDDLGKGIELASVSRALINLKAAGIGTYVYLLFGTARESLQEARNTLAFTKKHAGSIDFLNMAIFNLPAFGPDSDSTGLSPFYEGDLSLYANFTHPRDWGRGAVRQFIQREFTHEPAIAAIIRRNPPLFTSNHAPFFHRTL